MDCKLSGFNYQTLNVTLQPGERFYAERGTLVYLESGIDKSLQTNGSSLTRLLKSKLSGESAFVIEYENCAAQPKKMVFAINGGIAHVKLAGERFLCRRGAYIASTAKVDLGLGFSLNGFKGGLSFLQSIEGTATVFIESIGMPLVLDLGLDECIEVDENHLLALQGISEDRISANWSLSNLVQGEGLSMLNVTGPGKVYLSPSPFFLG